MSEQKKLFITIAAVSVILSSVFGAGAGLAVIYSDKLRGTLAEALHLPPDAGTVPSQNIITNVTEDSAVTAAVTMVNPAVVSVIVTKDLPKLEQFYYNPFGDDDFFGRFFGDEFLVPGTRQNGTERQEVGGGSGFIVSTDGLVVTNKHVVTDEEASYTVLMNDEKRYDATVLARDPVHDLAILKIQADEELPTVELGNSDSIQVGQTAIAIGNALGEFRNTVSAGVISGLARDITAGGGGVSEQLTNLIQTDASINPGNSGGPLLNVAGQVIGVNTAVAAGAQGIGFAIPINELKASIDSVKESGKIVRPWLGVRYVMLNEQIAEDNNFDVTEGALIVRGERRTDLAVVPGSPADQAGLEENDIILEVEGAALTEKNILAKEVAKYQPGEEIVLKVWHKGEEKEVKVILGEFGE